MCGVLKERNQEADKRTSLCGVGAKDADVLARVLSPDSLLVPVPVPVPVVSTVSAVAVSVLEHGTHCSLASALARASRTSIASSINGRRLLLGFDDLMNSPYSRHMIRYFVNSLQQTRIPLLLSQATFITY